MSEWTAGWIDGQVDEWWMNDWLDGLLDSGWIDV